MLPRTLLFLPGIGPVREGRLWKRGIETWADYRALPRVQGIRPRTKERHDQLLLLAESALRSDPGFFAHVLPPGEHWRAFPHFREGAAYIDIETTGDRENQVTVVGVRHAGQSRAFVKAAGQPREETWPCGGVECADYTPDAVTHFVRSATTLVTFNGASFDLPVLQNEGVRFPAVPHVDLRPALARAGYEGGLKRIEETLGLGRAGDLKGLSGWDAVKLWRRWERDGDRAALDRLVAYNVADFENLEPLADVAFRTLEAQLLAPLTHQARLPIAPPAARPAGP